MPLKQLYKGAKAKAILVTAEPWFDADSAKADAIKFFDDHFPHNIIRRHCVAEIGTETNGAWDSGYKHIHLAIEFVNRCKPAGKKYDF